MFPLQSLVKIIAVQHLLLLVTQLWVLIRLIRVILLPKLHNLVVLLAPIFQLGPETLGFVAIMVKNAMSAVLHFFLMLIIFLCVRMIRVVLLLAPKSLNLL